MTMQRFFLFATLFITGLVTTGCEDSGSFNIDISQEHSGNASQRDVTEPNVTDADIAGSLDTSGHVATPLKKGRWDPPAIRKRPLSGVQRQRQLRYTAIINEEAKKAGMDPRFVHAIISQESSYKSTAISKICKGKGASRVCRKDHTTAHGLMQLMPGTARSLGLNPSMRRSHPRLNVRAGIKYLAQMRWAGGNMQAMAAGYNSGPARAKALLKRNKKSKYWRSAQISTSNGVPGPKFGGGETYHYAQHVAGFYDLYKSNPQLIGLAPTHRASMCDQRQQC